MVKCLSTIQETWVRSLGREDSLEKEMTTHSSTLAWKIPWMEELGAGYCPWGRKESGTTERLHFHFIIYMGFTCGSLVKNPPAMQETWVRSLGWEDSLEKEMATHSSTLA